MVAAVGAALADVAYTVDVVFALAADFAEP